MSTDGKINQDILNELSLNACLKDASSENQTLISIRNLFVVDRLTGFRNIGMYRKALGEIPHVYFEKKSIETITLQSIYLLKELIDKGQEKLLLMLVY